MTIAIIDYGSGNLRSVAKAFESVADGKTVTVTSTPDSLKNASHIVLPGVGAFGDCMRGLKAVPGMLDALQDQVVKQGKQFLGICVGMQMLFEKSYEHGTHEGLGWLKGIVAPIPGEKHALKIPHMGWNSLRFTGEHPLLKDIQTGDHAYFVHSYYAACRNAPDMLATTTYGQTLAAVVGRGNILGTQFHPEKSQETGLKLLKNFLKL